MIARLPQIEIDVDGHRLPDRCARLFTELRVQQHLSLPSQCELTFVHVDEATMEAALPLGARLRVGERGVSTPVFEGCITALELGYDGARGSTLRARGYDDLFVLRNRQTVRSHVGLTAADLARELAVDLGIDVDAPTPGPVWSRLLQSGTDFDLLADVASRCGLWFTLRERTLHLLTLEGIGALQLLRLNENLLEATFESNSNGACRKVESMGWDPWRGEARRGAATRARVVRTLTPDARVAANGAKGERVLVARLFQDDQQADAAAQADLDTRSAREVVFRGVAQGNPQLRPGARVQIAGVAAAVAGIHVIASALHTLNMRTGYLSEITSALPPGREAPAGLMMTIGRVTRIDDPQQLGRLQVALTALDDVETDWLQILAPGAGAGKGLVAMPDIGDLVLLLMDAADAAQAMVLGSLYGAGGLPEGQEILGKGASFTFLSPGGQRIRLDDDKGTLRLENKSGSSVEMGADAVTLRAAAPLTIEAPGQRMTFRAQFIDFDRE